MISTGSYQTNLEKSQSRLWEDLIVAFQYLSGDYKKDGEQLFTWAVSDRTRGSNFKKERKLVSDEEDFTQRVVRR